MAIAAAAPALIDRVDPYWVMATSCWQTADQFVGEPRTLRAEDQADPLGQLGRLQRHGPRQVVDARRPRTPSALSQSANSATVAWWCTCQIAVGDHGPTAVPAASADDVHAADIEGVGRAHHRADVEVVLPVLDGDVQRVPGLIEIGDDRREASNSDSGRSHCAGHRRAAAPDQAGGRPARAPGAGRPRAPPRRPRSAPRLGNSQSAKVPFSPVTPLDAALLTPMLLPSWMDPEYLIHFFGPYALWGVAFIIFAECGLVRHPARRLAAVHRRPVRGHRRHRPLHALRLHGADRGRGGRQRQRLLDRPIDRATAVQAAYRVDRQDPEPQVRHQDPRLLREVRQPGADPGSLRPHRADVRHPGGRGRPDGLPQVHRLHRDRRHPVGVRGDHRSATTWATSPSSGTTSTPC